MQILPTEIAVIVVFWSGEIFTLSRIFEIALKWKEQIHIKFLQNMSKVVLTIIAFICINGPFNIIKVLSVTLLTSLSLLVAIVGFAAQQVLTDVISGVMPSRPRPLSLGGKVNISSLGISGTVEDMTMRRTVIRTYYNSRMIVPNSVINKAIVGNSNYNNNYIGNYMKVSVSYESSLEQTIGIMRKTIVSYPLVVDIRPNPPEGNKVNVTVKELGSGGIILKSTVWTRNIDDNLIACSDTRRLIKKNFDVAGISIPYRYVHMVTGNPDKKLEDNGMIQKQRRVTNMEVGITGAGSITSIVASIIKEMGYAQNYAVTTRGYERVAELAQKYGFEKACGSYEELVEDARVKLVYIAAPHLYHYEHTKLCLNREKRILREKSSTVSESQVREVFELVREKKLLLTEAIWIRYMLMEKTLDDVLLGGAIGRPYMLTANLGYITGGEECTMCPELAGGAPLDVGIYPLNFASMVFGDGADTTTSTVVMTETGVDAQNSITITHKDGRVVALCSSAAGPNDHRGIIYGDNGFIEVKSINNCEGVRIYDHSRNMIASYDTPKQINGYGYEVEACLRATEEGMLEYPEMPHEETLRMMGWMDELCRQWELAYPMEE